MGEIHPAKVRRLLNMALISVCVLAAGIITFIFSVLQISGQEKDTEDEEQRRYLQKWQEEQDRRKNHGTNGCN